MRDFPNETLSKNLLAISGFNLQEATAIGEAHPHPHVQHKAAKNGMLIPVVNQDGRDRPLHSLFDPIKEAKRLTEHVSDGGFVIVFGFGGGYHIRELLQNPQVESIIIIDFDYDVFRSIFSFIDVSDIFIDSRVRIFIDPDPQQLRNYLLERYIPALMGDVRSVPLRSRSSMAEQAFNAVSLVVQNTIESVSDDYSVQARFGKRWMSNTIANLAIAERSVFTLSPQKKAMIIAAGPSLDNNVETISKLAKDHFCIATDTALPWLLHNSITPDIILSIDCQTVTYHHFLYKFPQEIPVLFDLASPPTLSRQIHQPLFFSSGHPFSQYVHNTWRTFPEIDTSGGNVTHAAVSLAHILHVQQLKIFGADYCYPNGKTYANGTYLYHYFRSKENRFSSCESALADFVFHNAEADFHRKTQTTIYQTPSMRGYKHRIQQLLTSVPITIENFSPYWGNVVQAGSKHSNCIRRIPRWNQATENWKQFLKTYAKNLLELELPKQNLTRFFTDQDKKSLQLWMTVFPAAAYFRHNSLPESQGKALLETSRKWIVSEIEKAIQSQL